MLRRILLAAVAATAVVAAPDHVLIDGLPVRPFPIEQTALVGGDALSFSIAAASVIAKVTRDLTERKRAEEERIQLLAQEEAARERVRRKEEFLHMLAHELRNPLAPILTNLYTARLAANDSRTRERALEAAERQTQRLSQIIHDLLEALELGAVAARWVHDPDLARLQHDRLAAVG